MGLAAAGGGVKLQAAEAEKFSYSSSFSRLFPTVNGVECGRRMFLQVSPLAVNITKAHLYCSSSTIFQPGDGLNWKGLVGFMPFLKLEVKKQKKTKKCCCIRKAVQRQKTTAAQRLVFHSCPHIITMTMQLPTFYIHRWNYRDSFISHTKWPQSHMT